MKSRWVILSAMAVIVAATLWPMVSAGVSAYRVPQAAPKIMGDYWSRLSDHQQQQMTRDIRCAVMHRGMRSYAIVPDNVRDQTLIHFGCDPVRMWTLTQRARALRWS